MCACMNVYFSSVHKIEIALVMDKTFRVSIGVFYMYLKPCSTHEVRQPCKLKHTINDGSNSSNGHDHDGNKSSNGLSSIYVSFFV